MISAHQVPQAETGPTVETAALAETALMVAKVTRVCLALLAEMDFLAALASRANLA